MAATKPPLIRSSTVNEWGRRYRRNSSLELIASTLLNILTSHSPRSPLAVATFPTGHAPGSPSSDSDERKQAEACTQATDKGNAPDSPSSDSERKQADACTQATDEGNAPDSPSSDSEERKRVEACMQASYNALALIIVFVTGCIVVGMYYILEPFLYPLLWAVLIGTVLHPVKQASTSGIREWLDKSTIPLSFRIMLCPIFFVKWLTFQFERIVFSKTLWCSTRTVGVVVLRLMYAPNLPLHFFRLLQFVSPVLHFVDSLMSYTGFLQVSHVQ